MEQYYIYIISLLACSCFTISFFYWRQVLRNKYIKDSSHPDDIVFIKKDPNDYDFVKGDRKDAKRIYPYFGNIQWSEIEESALTGNDQSILCQDGERMYRAKITRMQYFGQFALLITLYELENGMLSREEDEIFSKTDFVSMCIDNDFNIIYKNKAAELAVPIKNLYDSCCDKDVLLLIRDSRLCTSRTIGLNINNNIHYFNFNFYPKIYIQNDKAYYFVIGYDTTQEIQYRNEIALNTKTIRILRDGIYNLFVHANKEQSFQDLLLELSEVLKAQWAFIYRVYNNEVTLEYEWHDATVDNEDDLYSKMNKEYYTKFLTKECKPLIVHRDNISDERRKVWDSLGIRYKVIMPLFSQDNELWGFIGFGCDTKQESRHLEKYLGLLQVIAVTMNVVIILQQNRQQINALNSKLNTIISTLTNNMIRENAVSKEINDSLKSTMNIVTGGVDSNVPN